MEESKPPSINDCLHQLRQCLDPAAAAAIEQLNVAINARVDRRTYRWVAAERVAVEPRTDGRSVNTGGEALPVGIPIACGIDVSEAGPARSNENYFGGL